MLTELPKLTYDLCFSPGHVASCVRCPSHTLGSHRLGEQINIMTSVLKVRGCGLAWAGARLFAPLLVAVYTVLVKCSVCLCVIISWKCSTVWQV